MFLANFLIGLREGLEAALVVSILIAYLVKSGRAERVRHVWAGVLTAVAVSAAFGAALTFGPRELSERGEELIAGTLSLVAVGFVTWMIFWMAGAARGLGAELRGRLDTAVQAGRWALVAMAAVAVGREGLETALFLWAATQAAAGTTGAAAGWTPVVAALAGLGVAGLLGWLIYRGALSLDLGTFFRWTGALLAVVAAGVLAYAVHEFQEAGVLPGEDLLAFDLTHSVDASAWWVSVIRGIFNVAPAMSVLAVAAWLAYAVPVVWLYLARTRPHPAGVQSPEAPSQVRDDESATAR